MSSYHDHRHLPVIILNREIEDMGLTAYEYRVYCRVVRRAGRGKDGRDHKCFESVESMAHACQVSTGTVKRSLRRLVEMRMLTRHSIPGQASEYRLTDPDLWIPSHETTQVTTDPGGGSETTQGVVTTDPGGGSETTQGVDQRRPTKKEPIKKKPLSNNPLRGGAIEAPFPPGDPFEQSAAAKDAQIFLMGLDGNTWNLAALKAWASCWDESGRNPGKDYINLKKFIRKRIHPKSEDHQSFLDEYQGIKASLDRAQRPPADLPQPLDVPKPGSPEYEEELHRRRMARIAGQAS